MPDSLRPLLERFSLKTPGCAAIVLHKDQVVFEHYAGAANLEHGIAAGHATVFPLASVSKMFTALMIGILAQQGKLALNASANSVLDLPLPEHITVQHLLTMSSGIRESFELLTMLGSPRWVEHSTQDHLRVALKCKSVDFPPGADMLYANINYILLGLIIEKLTQTTYDQAITNHILKPLGMDETTFFNTKADIIPNRAEFYVPQDGGYITGGGLSTRMGLGSMASTARGLLPFLKLLQAGSFEGVDLKEFYSHTPALLNGATSRYGNGSMHTQYRGLDIVYHTGGYCGSSSLLLHIPAADTGILLLSNDDTFNRFGLAESLIDQFVPQASAIVASAPPAVLDGVYFHPEDGEWLTVQAVPDSIVIQHMISTYTLYKHNDTWTTRWGGSGVSIAASPDVSQGLNIRINGVDKTFIRRELAEAPLPRFNDYTGRYQNEDIDAVHDIYFEGTQLMIRFGHFTNDALTFALIPTAKDSFLFDGGPHGWGHSYVLVFDREPHSKMLRGYRLSSYRTKGIEVRRLRSL